MTPESIPDLVKNQSDVTDVFIATDESLAAALMETAPAYQQSNNGKGIKFVAFDADNDINIPLNGVIVRPRWFRAMYLAGVVCAMETKNRKVGLIVEKPTSIQLIQYANAFFLGVKTVNANITVGMATVDAWNTSIAAQAAAESLQDWGAGCLSAAQGNSVANQIFSNSKLPSIGFASNSRIFSGDQVRTSFLIDPAPTFTMLMEKALNSDWDNVTYLYSSSDVERGDWSIYVDIPTRKVIDAQVLINNNGSFAIFCHPGYLMLGLTWNNSNTGLCPEEREVFDPNVMKLTTHIVKVAEWTTYSATTRVYWRWTSSLSIIYYTIGGVLLLFCLYLIPHIIYYRRTRVYATASWLVLLMVPIALIITISSGTTYLGSPSIAQCHLRLWIESLGVVLLLGSLQARNFTHFMWKKRGLTQLTKEYENRFTVGPYSLFVQWLLPLLLADLIILTFFSSITPIYNIDETAAFLDSGSVQAICKSQNNTLYYLLNAYHAVIAITNLVFFYVLKNIPLLGTDVVATGATVLNLVFFAGLNIFVSVIVGRAIISVALAIGLKLIVSVVALAVLIIPKWWAIQFRGVREELDLIENSRNTDSSIISTTSNGAAGVVTFAAPPGAALRPKEQLPEFYSDSSESPSISISSEFFDDESGSSDMDGAEDESSSSSESEGFGSGMKRLERFKRAQAARQAASAASNGVNPSSKSGDDAFGDGETGGSKRSASNDSLSKTPKGRSALRQSDGSLRSGNYPDESETSSDDPPDSPSPKVERSPSPAPNDAPSTASESGQLSSLDEDHDNFRKDDRV